jgi:hypothetical protein
MKAISEETGACKTLKTHLNKSIAHIYQMTPSTGLYVRAWGCGTILPSEREREIKKKTFS